MMKNKNIEGNENENNISSKLQEDYIQPKVNKNNSINII